MLQNLKAEIIRHYGNQSNFAQAMQVDESRISRIVRGRRLLTKAEASKWQKMLNCEASLLTPVTKID